MKIIAYRHRGFSKPEYYFTIPFMFVSLIAMILVYSIIWGGYKSDLKIYNEMRPLEEYYASIYPYYPMSDPPIAPVKELLIGLAISGSFLAIFSFIFFHTLYVDKTTPLHTLYLEDDIYYVYNRKKRDYVKIPEDKLISLEHGKTTERGYRNLTGQDISKNFGKLSETIEVRHTCCYMYVKYYDKKNNICKIKVQSYVGPIKEK